VADFATRLFGYPFTAGQVIEETLVTFTAGELLTREELVAALAGPLPDQLEDFRRHPLARWVEREFGVEPEAGGRLKRRVPRTLAQAAERLAQETESDTDVCVARRREVLNRGGMLVREDGGRAFAFKLHQFIGQGRALFATLEATDRREFSLGGQVQAGGGRLFVPIKFCRQCGQDYYHVLQSDGRFLPHPVGTESADDESHPGYLMLAPADNDWNEERIPEEWRDPRGRLKQTWRDRVPQALWVAPDGDYTTQPRQGAVKMWWQAAPFALCLSCGEFYTAREREFGKLAALEAREHTAQVVTPGERERRERRFRWEDSDTLKASELGRRLPYLVCSPTMELGVGIADLDLVHLRNVPPTPANYAQRPRRAAGTARSDFHLLRRAQQSRPVFLPPPGRDGRRQRATAATGSGQ
jgi:hypothetical protein